MKSTKILFLFVLYGGIISLLVSCSIEKRLYNKGFHIQKHTFYSENKQDKNQSLTGLEFEEKTLENTSVDDSNEAENEGITMNKLSDCDTILLVNGDTLFGYASIQSNKLIEVEDCNTSKLKVVSIPEKEVHQIRYSYGEVKTYNALKLPKLGINDDPKNLKPLAILSLVFLGLAIIFLIMSWVFTSGFNFIFIAIPFTILAFVFGLISMIVHYQFETGFLQSLVVFMLSCVGIVISIIYALVNFFHFP